MNTVDKTIPVKPVLPFSRICLKKSTIKTVFRKKNSLALTSARAGIALALKQLKIQAGEKVLIPAFHCTAMVEPVVWLGVTPIFYKIKIDCSLDFKDLQSKLDPQVKAIIVVHYFGFPQDILKVREFCDDNKIFLIEDCAHSFWGESSGIGLGEIADWAVTSAMKFFPIMEGGILYSSRHLFHGQKLYRAPILTNLKAFLNTFETAFAFGRMKFLSCVFKQVSYVKEIVWKILKQKSAYTNQFYYLPSASHGGYSFEPYWMDKKMSLVSQAVIKILCEDEIIRKRRFNYIKLLTRINGLKGVKPVFPELPGKVVPHVLPILVDEPEKILKEFKKKHIPFLRFGEVLWQNENECLCQISLDYSKNGFQLPCHQDLTPQELSLIMVKLDQIFDK